MADRPSPNHRNAPATLPRSWTGGSNSYRCPCRTSTRPRLSTSTWLASTRTPAPSCRNGSTPSAERLYDEAGRGAEMSDRPASVPDALYPFESCFAEIGGARVHYVDEGNGPPLLLLHGNLTCAFRYRDVIK